MWVFRDTTLSTSQLCCMQNTYLLAGTQPRSSSLRICCVCAIECEHWCINRKGVQGGKVSRWFLSAFYSPRVSFLSGKASEQLSPAVTALLSLRTGGFVDAWLVSEDRGEGVWLLPIQLLLLRLCLPLLLLPPPPQGAPWNCEMHPLCSSEEAQVRKFSGLKVLLFSWCLSNVNPDASAQPILLLQQGETPVLKAEVQTGPCCPQHPALPSPLSCKPHSCTTGLLGAWMKYSPHPKENTMKYI